MSNQLAFEQLSRYNEQKSVALEKASETIKRLKKKVKDLQIRNKNLLATIYENS